MDWLTFIVALIGICAGAGLAGQAVAAWRDVRLADAKAYSDANGTAADDDSEIVGDVPRVPRGLH